MATNEPLQPWQPHLVPKSEHDPLSTPDKFEGLRFQVPEEFLDRYPPKVQLDSTEVRAPITRDIKFPRKICATMQQPFGKLDAYPDEG